MLGHQHVNDITTSKVQLDGTQLISIQPKARGLASVLKNSKGLNFVSASDVKGLGTQVSLLVIFISL